MTNPFRPPPRTADVAIPLGLAAGFFVVGVAELLSQAAPGLREAVGTGPVLAYAVSGALRETLLVALVSFAALAAGLKGRRAAALVIGIALVAALSGALLQPLATRWIGVGHFRSEETWLPWQALAAVVTDTAPDGTPLDDVSRFGAVASATRPITPLVIAALAFAPFLTARRARFPWWSAAPLAFAGKVVPIVLWGMRDIPKLDAWALAWWGIGVNAIVQFGIALAMILANIRWGAEPQPPAPSPRGRTWSLAAAAFAVVLALQYGHLVRGLFTDSVAAAAGKPAPGAHFGALDGAGLSVPDLRGRVVVLAHWATWCGPCRMELPELEKMQRELGERGLQVLAVNDGEPEKLIRDFVKETSLGLPVLIADRAALDAWPAPGLPTTYFVGRDGIVRHVQVGYGPGLDLRGQLEKLLAEAP